MKRTLKIAMVSGLLLLAQGAFAAQVNNKYYTYTGSSARTTLGTALTYHLTDIRVANDTAGANDTRGETVYVSVPGAGGCLAGGCSIPVGTFTHVVNDAAAVTTEIVLTDSHGYVIFDDFVSPQTDIFVSTNSARSLFAYTQPK